MEQTLSIAKSNLEIRPVFHYNTKRIRAHFLICYMSLALIRYVEFALLANNLHYPIDQLHLLLEQMNVTNVYHADNNVYTLLEDPPPELRQIKPCIIGRKNYLFAGSDNSAKHAATIYSIIETCKLNGINTFNYLADIFKRTPNLKANQLDQLLPFNWQPQQ